MCILSTMDKNDFKIVNEKKYINLKQLNEETKTTEYETNILIIMLS